MLFLFTTYRTKCCQLLTGSVDNTLKLWKGPSDDLTDDPEHIICTQTVLAHDRDINSIDIAPNDRLIVTASRDKTAKVRVTLLVCLFVFINYQLQ